MNKVLIIGGGAAGMACAVFLARAGIRVDLFEKNEKLGKKVYITGKGRCNFTNVCDEETLMSSVVTNPKFLFHAFSEFSPEDAVRFFEELGVKTKVERGNRAFPKSDHASDLILAMERKMKELDVKIHLKSKASSLITVDGRVTGLTLENGSSIFADAVVIACGGLSYPSTGSTGDGYTFARACGHKIVEPMPSLVPLVTKESYIPEMQGLSLKNVTLQLYDGKKCVYKGFGEMMFTHFGITGPLVLTASAVLSRKAANHDLTAAIDWKPALDEKQLNDRLLREFKGNENRLLKTVVSTLLPQKSIPVFMNLTGETADKKVHDVTKEERSRLIRLLKNFPFTVVGRRDFNEAIITKGGVNVKEVHPGTMESKLVKDLYLIGEVLDLDALTGGFNLQIAWSTAYVAAQAMILQQEEQP